MIILQKHSAGFLHMSVENLEWIYMMMQPHNSCEASVRYATTIAYSEYVRNIYPMKIPKTLKDNLLPKPTPSIF